MSVDDLGVVELTRYEDSPLANYLKLLSPVPAPPIFIKTEQFKRIILQANSTDLKLLLTGPSGSGKTTTLVALAYFYQFVKTDKFIPILLTQSSFLSVQLKMLKNFICQCNISFNTSKVFIENLLGIVRKRNVITLIDMGEFTREQEISTLIAFAASGANVVVAMSSGMYNSQKLSNSFSRFEQQASIITFTSFSRSEMNLYMETTIQSHQQISPEELDDIVMQTNCNPRLLESMCLFSSEARSVSLQRMSNKITESLKKSLKVYDSAYLPKSINLLQKAISNERMTEDEFRSMYCSTVVVKENLVYLCDGMLYLSYPVFYRDITESFYMYAVKTNSKLPREVKGLLNGLHLEREFRLQSQSSTFQITVGDVENQFSIERIQVCNGPLRNVGKEILYFLRPKHPVVDALGMFGDILYYFQFSIVKYKEHVKAEELFKERRFEFNGDTVSNFYNRKFGNAELPVYVYVSPHETEAVRIKEECTAKLKSGRLSTPFLCDIYATMPYKLD